MKLIICLFAVTLVACQSKVPSAPAPLQVVASFYPLVWLAQEIGGDAVKVVSATPASEDPASWLPDEATLALYQGADLVALNGAEFEGWTDKVSLPGGRTVRTADGLRAQWLRYEKATTHSHGNAGAHAHEGVDGHTWLDPVLLTEQAQALTAVMTKRAPVRAEAFKAGLARVTVKLEGLDERLKTLSPTLPPLLAAHPAYSYIGRRYGWRLKSLDLDPAAALSEATRAQVRGALGQAKILLWESAPRLEVAAALQAEFGLKSVVFSPVERAPEMGDYLEAMGENLNRLASATR